MKKIEAFKCDFCEFTRERKELVYKHESRCYYNPKNKACATCGLFSQYHETVYNPTHGGNPGSTDYDELFYNCGEEPLESKRVNCDKWIIKHKESTHEK